jgi:hypothetical protein
MFCEQALQNQYFAVPETELEPATPADPISYRVRLRKTGDGRDVHLFLFVEDWENVPSG